MYYFITAGLFMLILAILGIICLLPNSELHIPLTKTQKKPHRILTAVVALVTIALCVLPMGLCDLWNGKQPDHRNQYELTAQAFLEGHLNIEYDDYDERLEQMENPYNAYERAEQKIPYHWDHSFYKGKYYMYFGVVPVIFLFLPFLMITGVSLPAYIGTGIFVAGFILGIFALFRKISALFFPKLSYSIYLYLSVAFSMMSVWFCTATPALYCTATSSALCMIIWSMYFFISAAWGDDPLKKALIYAALGALFGALCFGCRPNIALSNLLVLPMLIVFLKKRGFSKKIFGGLLLAALPYLVVGILLMIYNYVRFENPFEFGLSYQLTALDVTPENLFKNIKFSDKVNDMLYYLVGFSDIKKLSTIGTLLCFPILLYTLISLGHESVRKKLREKRFSSTLICMLIMVLIIVIVDVIYSPLLVDRYRLDYVWLLGLITFICIGFLYCGKKNQKGFSTVVCIMALITAEMSILLFLWPHDWNYTFVKFADNIDGVIAVLRSAAG